MSSDSPYEDITYEIDAAAAVITINRPERYNAFRGKTVEELVKAFRAAWADNRVSAIILTGAGDKAFCTGGDVKQRAETGDYGPTESGMFEIGYLHKLIRDVPKPVIAASTVSRSAAGMYCTCCATSRSRPSMRRSDKPGRGSGHSTQDSDRRIWRGWSAKSGRGRCGFCVAGTTPPPPNAGDWSTTWCPPRS